MLLFVYKHCFWKHGLHDVTNYEIKFSAWGNVFLFPLSILPHQKEWNDGGVMLISKSSSSLVNYMTSLVGMSLNAFPFPLLQHFPFGLDHIFMCFVFIWLRYYISPGRL